ncbi:MAG: hypothetical protein ACOH5I_08195 [Oligoflexus sp.]
MKFNLRPEKPLHWFLFASVLLSLVLWVRFWLLPEPDMPATRGLGSTRQQMIGELSAADNQQTLASRVQERQLRKLTGRFHEAWERQDQATAESILAELQQQFPEHSAVLVDQALFQLLQSKNVSQAAQSFHRLMERSRQTGHDPSRLMTAIIALIEQAEMWEAGQLFLSELADLQGGLTANAQLAMGRFLFYDEKYQQAMLVLNEIQQNSKQKDNDVLAQALVTQILMSLGDTEGAIVLFKQTEHALEQKITERMRRGDDVAGLAKEMEGLQFYMAEQLVAVNFYADAEMIVLKLAKKFPAHPDVVKLLDQIRLYKLEVGAG